MPLLTRSRCRLLLLACVVLITSGPACSFAQAPWVDLFAGQQFSGWERLGGRPRNASADQTMDAILRQNWRFTDDGWLHLYRPGGGGCSLLLSEDIGDFELSFFWKIRANANSGIKYRVCKYGQQTLGIEYQILDDQVNQEKTIAKHRTASIYDVYPPLASKPLNPVETINHSRIRARGNRIEHWLNGVNVASANTTGGNWNRAVGASKFAPHSDFGKNPRGKLMITDHGGQVWYRDVLLKRF